LKQPKVRCVPWLGLGKSRGSKAPYFCIFEAEFENEAALMSALASKEGQAVAGDVPNYASGGVTMVHFAV
jgi:hypothetical protein